MSGVVVISAVGSALSLVLLFASAGASGPQMGAPVIPLGAFFLLSMPVLSLFGSLAAWSIPKEVKKKEPLIRYCSGANYLCFGLFFGLFGLFACGVLKL